MSRIPVIEKAPRIFFYLGCITIAQLNIRPALSTTLSDYFFLISFLLAIINTSIQTRDIAYNIPKLIQLGAYFFLLNVFITLYFIEDDKLTFVALGETSKIIYIWLVWFWTGQLVLKDLTQLKLALFLFGISCAISANYGLMQTPQYYWERPNGMADHVNQFGCTCGMGLMVSVGFLTHFKYSMYKRNKFFFFTTIYILIICSCGLFVAKSLGSLIAVAATFIVWFILKGEKKRKIIVSCIIVSITVFALIYQHQHKSFSIIKRFQEQSQISDSRSTLSTRLFTYQQTIQKLFHNPLIGSGGGYVKGIDLEAHNMILKVLHNYGLISVVGLCIILYSTFTQLRFLYNRSQTIIEKEIASSLILSFLTYILIGMKEPIFYNRFGWFPLLIAISMHNIERHKEPLATQPQTSSPSTLPTVGLTPFKKIKIKR